MLSNFSNAPAKRMDHENWVIFGEALISLYEDQVSLYAPR